MKLKCLYLILIVVFVIAKGYLFSNKYVQDKEDKEYVLFIENLKSVSKTKVAYKVKLLNTNDKFILNICDSSYDSIEKDMYNFSKYTYGDVIKVTGKISIPKKLNNPGEFDYKTYLYSNNIHGIVSTYESPEEICHSFNLFQKFCKKIYDFKQYIQELISSCMKEDEKELLVSMVYGDTMNLNEQMKTDFKELGTSHLLSVSGTHITSFMMIINLFLGENKFIYNKRRKAKSKNNRTNKNKAGNIKAFIQIICIFIYMLFTGFSISVLRAGIMLIISIVCNKFKIKKNKYKTLFFILIIIITYNPYVVFNTGLVLSFLATLGIFMFYGPIFKVCDKLIDKIKQDAIKRIIIYLLQNIVITISVQLMIIPVQIQSFNQIPFPLFTSNLILGTISLPIRLFGMLGIMTSFTPCVAKIFFELTNIFIQILIFAVNILKKVSYSFGVATLPMIFIVIYYIVIFLLFVYFRLKDVSKDIKTYNLTRVLYWLKHAIITLIVLVIILVVTFNVYSIYFSKYVYFFNVEQGEMSNIKYGKTNIIIDIGSMKERLAFNTIFNYYKRNNISSIDAVIISHLHKDHINGLEQLLKTFNVDMVICSVPKTISDTYIEFKNVIAKYDVLLKEVNENDEILIGKIKIEVLLPGEEYIKEDEINANSLVCKITAGGTKLLYMGDANKEAEQKLINENKLENIDILKVGHHGSKSATSCEFINKIKPKYAVISALKKYYNHPHEDTLNVLRENNVYTYITEKYGAIKFAL